MAPLANDKHMMTLAKQAQRQIRHRRVRAKINGTKDCPRLSVFRSHRHIYAQLIDDQKGKTLVSVSDAKIKANKTVAAKEVGQTIAKGALDKKIKKAVFDRGGYRYHGRIKALAEGAREGGLKF